MTLLPGATYHNLNISYVSHYDTTCTTFVRLYIPKIFFLFFMDYVQFNLLQMFFDTIKQSRNLYIF